MANVLITHSGFYNGSELVDTCFYEGLINDLIENGNNVIRILTGDLIKSAWNGSNELHMMVNSDKLFSQIKLFKPDFIMAFNGSYPKGLDTILDCPFLIMEADRFLFYNDKEYLKQNQERFIFCNTTERTLEDTKKYLGNSINFKGAVVPFATSVRSDKEVEQTCDISFIGTCFQTSLETQLALVNYKEKDFYKSLERVEKMHAATARERVLLLDSVSGMDLRVYGNDSWLELKSHFLRLASCYVKEKVYSLADNQRVYNSSRLGLSINHKQAIDGFSFRVMDVMASNSCLIVNKNSGESNLVKDYVELPTYESAQDLRNISTKLIKEKSYREDIVEASNSFVDKFARWDKRFEIIEKLTSLKIINVSGAKGSVDYLDLTKFFHRGTNILLETQGLIVRCVPSKLYPLGYKILKKLNLPVPQSTIAKAKNRIKK